jgi:hypothetical protein
MPEITLVFVGADLLPESLDDLFAEIHGDLSPPGLLRGGRRGRIFSHRGGE